jgi:hypothetical protein
MENRKKVAISCAQCKCEEKEKQEESGARCAKITTVSVSAAARDENPGNQANQESFHDYRKFGSRE